MNSYQNYQNNNISNNIANQIKERQNLNYVYNHCNQNIDHIRDNFNNKPIEQSPYQIKKNYNRNNSNEVSSVLNNSQYNNFHKNIQNHRLNNPNFSADNSNFVSTNYSSFENNPNINIDNNNNMNRKFFNNNMEMNPNNIFLRNSYQSMPANYPNNININSRNNSNNSLNGSEVINFNGINYSIGSKINNINNHNPYEPNFRRSNYSNKSENINIGNNVFNINLSSITSQDIFQSYELQKKQNEKKKKEAYLDQLNKQVEEKNKRKELERKKKLEEDLKYEQKYQNYYKQFQEKEKKEEIDKNNEINNIINNNEQIIKKNNDVNKLSDENDLDKNIIDTIRKNQYPLINDLNENSNIKNIRANSSSNKKRNYNYNANNNQNSDSKISTTSSMIKSGLNIIEGNKNRGNSYDNNFRDKNNFNNNMNIINKFDNSDFAKKIDNTHKETEDYLDQIIKKTDILSQTLQQTDNNNDQDRMKEILKVLDENKIDNKNNSNYTPIKNKNMNELSKKNNNIDPVIQGINLRAIKYHSKYENNENDNNLNKKGNNPYSKNHYNSNQKRHDDSNLEESIKGMSKLIASTSKQKNEDYTNKRLNNDYYKNKDDEIMSFINQRKQDKKYILKDEILSKNNNNEIEQDKEKEYNIPNNEIIQTKDSLNSNMKLTFGENGNLKFSKTNNNKIDESNSTFSENNQEQSKKLFTFGDNFGIKNNNEISNSKNNKNIKQQIKEDVNENNEEDYDEDDEEKYDIKVNSENDINYDNMLKSTKKSDLKFLDFDQFCDVENEPETENNKKKTRKKKKKLTKGKNKKNNLDTDDDLCNIISEREEEEEQKEINKMTESKKIQNQLNFFSDSISKGISHRRNDKSIFNSNHNKKNENKNDDDEDKKTVSDFDKDDNKDDEINLLSNNQFEEMKRKTEKKNNNETMGNILEESGDLKDSYCDDILKNLDKYRGELQKED